MATQADALAEARKLQAAIQAYGIKCVIDLRQGASSSGWLNPPERWAGELSHHIVSRRSHGLTRFYQMCRDGREGVPGPLCNGYMGWDMVYRIITMGIANHSGKGGPLTLAGRTIPKDNGRYYLWGTEFEGGMIAEEWTPEFHDAMARVNAGILDWQGRPTPAHGEHLTWAPGRKNDRLGYTAGEGRRRIEYVRGKGTGMIAVPVPPMSIAPAPAPAPAPVPSEYPAIPLVEDGAWFGLTTRAFQIVMQASGRYKGRIDTDFGGLSITAMQEWLASLGYYKGRIEAHHGEEPVWGVVGKKALQAFLYDKGLYRNGSATRAQLVDGDFASRSVTGFQAYLNSQRQYL